MLTNSVTAQSDLSHLCNNYEIMNKLKEIVYMLYNFVEQFQNLHERYIRTV